ncbi:MAG: ParB N-terminal domain-containing protein [Myxococcaceae bacterium]|nr:ParB N-terminal domain-containing protein [Myxococcaceae bacterium]MCI0672156.1 ParB N-terminal domain-containing protein [Myxococcaceae bacterium]
MAVKQKRKARAPRRKKVAPRTRGLEATEVGERPSPEALALAEHIREDGGAALALYRDPIGGHPIILASLPVDKVEPTPFQRDRSEPHVKRLATAMERVDRYLDPLIAVRHDGRYWTPNGNHRLGAAKLLGARAVMALVLPEEDVAFQILALNTEKAHNLRERSLETIRMLRGLVETGRRGTEDGFAAIFEEPALLTLGAAYEKRPRFAAGAYNPVLKKVDGFLELPLREALEEREARAEQVLELDDVVSEAVSALKARGLESPYLKAFVVARINFLRFVKAEAEPPEFDEALAKLLTRARRFDAGKVQRADLASMAGALSAEE